MVRLGIALYGFWPGPAVEHACRERLTLCPVMTWKTRVAAVKSVPHGGSVGYSGSYVTTRPSRLAVLPLGYYDGYSRSLSNLGQVLIHGQQLLGQQGTLAITAEEMATWLGTIHYEVTTRINPLIPRLVIGS